MPSVKWLTSYSRYAIMKLIDKGRVVLHLCYTCKMMRWNSFLYWGLEDSPKFRIPDVSFVKSVEVLILSAFPLFFCFLKVCYSGVTSLFMKLPHCAGMVRGLKIIDNRRKRIRKLRKKNKSKQIALS